MEKLFIITIHDRKNGWPIYFKHQYIFRHDPVPRTGKSGKWSKKWKFRYYYKLPKSTNERRQFDKDFGRVKRSPRHLPDSWDDIPRADLKTRRNWKNKKVKKQYMKNLDKDNQLCYNKALTLTLN